MSIEVGMRECQFNASIQVTELLMKTLENVSKDLACRCITEAASRHGFNAEEEIRVLGLENLSLIRKQMARKSAAAKGELKKNKKVVKDKKSVFPMPFIAECVDTETGCLGLAYNRGLFTQCTKKHTENSSFCNGCQTEADNNGTGFPDCGTVNTRINTGLYEFKDSKGRSPISYLKVLQKLKLTADAAIEEAGKLSIEIPTEHLVATTLKTKNIKGRPAKAKKTGAIEADNVTDLFAKLSFEGECDDDDTLDSADSKPKTIKTSKNSKLTEEEKEVKKAALETERAQKKAERDAKLATERAEKEALRKAEADIKKAERDAKLATEKEEREAKRVAEKEEREAKKVADKALAEQKKGTSKSTKTKKTDAPAKSPEAEPAPTPAPTAKVSVTRIQISGKSYLKSSTNILYDPSTKEEVGIWDPETKSIKALPEEEEEEEEEEYDN